MNAVSVGSLDESGAPLLPVQHDMSGAKGNCVSSTVAGAATSFYEPSNLLDDCCYSVENSAGKIRQFRVGMHDLIARDAVASLLNESIVDFRQRAVRAGHDPKGVRHGLEIASEAVGVELKKLARQVTTELDLASAIRPFLEGEEKIGQLISRAIMVVGSGAAFRVIASRGAKDEVKINGGAARPTMPVSMHTNRNTFALSALETCQGRPEDRGIPKGADLMNGFALSVEIHVTGNSSADIERRMRLYSRAILAARIAMREGVLAGKGVALMYASDALYEMPSRAAAEQAGVAAMKRALHAPTRRIVRAGRDDASLRAGNLIDMSFPRVGATTERNECVNLVSQREVTLTTLVLSVLWDGVHRSFAANDEGKVFDPI